LQALTEQFGPAGIGWTFEITDRWTETGPHDQVGAFVNVLLFICVEGEWSRGIPGTGGSMLIAKENAGPYFSDEAYKMATTDAISVAAKALGVGSDVYMGVLSHKESKYQRPAAANASDSAPVASAPSKARHDINERIKTALTAIYGKNREAMKSALIELTTWEKDGKTITGKPNYENYSDKQAAVVVKELEKVAGQKQQGAEREVCRDCGQQLENGICKTPSCPSAEPF
jgi:hypothetical protein